MKAKLLIELVYRRTEARLIHLKEGALSGLHRPHGKVKATIHARITHKPPNRSLLHLLVEVPNQSRLLASLLVQKVDHVHILFQLITGLLCLWEGSVLFAVVQFFATVRPNHHLASDYSPLNGTWRQPLWLQPIWRRIWIPLSILLYSQLPNGAIGREFQQTRSNVVDSPASQSTLVLAKLGLHNVKGFGCILVLRVLLQQQFKIVVGLLPQRHGDEGLCSTVQGLLIVWIPVQDLVSQLLHPVPLASLDVNLRHVVPQYTE
mmetsp:Transcript_75910/g.180422  ORF Transcript_75910/g.180422 Transcript_75910/m.180422 type:complete len:262 (+) Transcript_75910:755-1540(+)